MQSTGSLLSWLCSGLPINWPDYQCVWWWYRVPIQLYNMKYWLYVYIIHMFYNDLWRPILPDSRKVLFLAIWDFFLVKGMCEKKLITLGIIYIKPGIFFLLITGNTVAIDSEVRQICYDATVLY